MQDPLFFSLWIQEPEEDLLNYFACNDSKVHLGLIQVNLAMSNLLITNTRHMSK